jgi:hypothetical protein
MRERIARRPAPGRGNPLEQRTAQAPAGDVGRSPGRVAANQKDLTVRFIELFDHYLKGAPAPKWLSEGVPYLKKDVSQEPAEQ